ncbi:MAG: YdeI/OmpD-associated family protein [Rhodobacteraceae bacterium]|jgi:hypothetical protein|nr:YdeI/OmpD-associated family protein [Paracoccaceae bacterium]
MDGWLSFEGRIETLHRGKSTYTLIRLPSDVAKALDHAGAARVAAEIADVPANLAVTRAEDVEGAFLWAGQSLLDRVGVQPGEWLDVRLRPADPDAVDVPDDVAAAIRSAGRQGAWDALTPGKRRGLLYQVTTAKTAPTRAKRIAALLAGLPDA